MQLQKENNIPSKGIKMTISGRRFHNALEGNYRVLWKENSAMLRKEIYGGPSEGNLCLEKCTKKDPFSIHLLFNL